MNKNRKVKNNNNNHFSKDQPWQKLALCARRGLPSLGPSLLAKNTRQTSKLLVKDGSLPIPPGADASMEKSSNPADSSAVLVCTVYFPLVGCSQAKPSHCSAIKHLVFSPNCDRHR